MCSSLKYNQMDTKKPTKIKPKILKKKKNQQWDNVIREHEGKTLQNDETPPWQSETV